MATKKQKPAKAQSKASAKTTAKKPAVKAKSGKK